MLDGRSESPRPAGNAATRANLRDAIAEALWARVNANDLADVCVALLGLAPQGDTDDPMLSKRRYVKQHLMSKTVPELIDLARKVVEEYGDTDLAAAVGKFGANGVDGELKNLIFAADGPKPRIVLRDAISNVIEVVENGEYCLIYDRPLAANGLTWRELVDWWSEMTSLDGDERERALDLYNRLMRSLANDAERLIFRTYCERYGRDGFDLPALIPQVYLHYDPYTRRQLGDQPGPLERQRMDFLLLFPRQVRVVIELDGVQHYADDTGRADPGRYARMVREDRRLRLAGYEVYRFGGHELVDKDAGARMLNEFFDALLERHQP
jgi:very-short-patch-repair endonuclease